MKKIYPFLMFLIALKMQAQQNISNNFLSKSKGLNKVSKNDKSDSFKVDLPWFGIEGSGNLNEETFKTTNGSMKATLYARPIQYGNKALTIYASYNVNASNNDSLLFSTLLFPEVGKNSFLGTVEWATYWKKNTDENKHKGHSLAPFLELSYKDIKTDSSLDGQKLYFSALNYTAGLKYVFNFFKKNLDTTGKDTEANFSFATYFSYLNIPNEDLDDYRAILARGKNIEPAKIQDNVFSWGLKVAFQINNFGIFADFRSVLGGDKKIPIRELRGFNANIGFTLNTEFIHLK